MNEVKVSQICTLKNEERSIKKFIDSLLSQSRIPDEIILVDGGSTDRTVEIINSYIKKGESIKLIVEDGVNIAKGRNIAIKNAKFDIIASTDAGCKLDKDWLFNLTNPFEQDLDVDVVSGWYEADAKTDFEEIVAALTYPTIEQVLKKRNEFLPSSRSIAYKKECWEKINGYPEWLYTAEDTLFDIYLKKAGCKFIFAPDAIVKWEVRPTLKKTIKQHYLYAKGDGQANLFLRSYLFNIGMYATGIIMFIVGITYHIILILLGALVLTYYLKPTMKVYKKLKYLKVIYLTSFIYTLINFTRIVGYSVGAGQRRLNSSRFK